jgi:rhodanese-related sulfurtransferase
MKNTSRVLSILVLAALACRPQSGTVPSISNQALAEEIKSGKPPLILDVRTPEEFQAGHIPGAVNIPHDQLASRLSELPISKSDEVVVHCEKGARAAKAESVLVASGYTHVVDLQGHMSAWRESGLPVQ